MKCNAYSLNHVIAELNYFHYTLLFMFRFHNHEIQKVDFLEFKISCGHYFSLHAFNKQHLNTCTIVMNMSDLIFRLKGDYGAANRQFFFIIYV